ncbi:SUMF1/EgtB/PvdO family nonheme iron enzyme [Catellatospora vulcania]|uniref:SUMF1/EgtB/PvdO family nonheme iron enzyme n=1 Tax=Catellatospora vulcania TaxID=1460450 RepID=UPI0012D46849|nr:SUMF1/EgtB/PvdO family nonheme iron enzyme [Catellatospora vulcania]
MGIERVERVVPQVVPPRSSVENLGFETKRYLREIVGRLNFPPERLGGIVNTTLPLGESWLDRRLIPIDASAAGVPPEDNEALGVPLESLLRGRDTDAPATSTVAIVGPSGLGKSTAFEMIAIREARSLLETGVGRLPIWLPAVTVLGAEIDLVSGDPMTILRMASPWIADQNTILASELDELTKRPGVSLLVLVDAIDQLDFDSLGGALAKFTRFLSRVESQHPKSLILLGSRDDVWFSDSCEPLRRSTTCFALQPLSLSDVANFVDVFEKHSRRIDEAYAERLKARIGAEPWLGNLLRRPLMLALAMFVVEQTGHLPPGLGGICYELTKVCLSDSFNRSGTLSLTPDAPRLGNEILLPVLQLVAWSSGERQRNSPLASLAAVDLAACVRQVLAGTDRYSIKMASTTEVIFVNMAHDGVGLFGELAPNEFGFADDAFRMYFAGGYLANMPRETLMTTIASREDCAELVIWGQMCAYTGEIDSAVVLIEDLLDESDLQYLLLAGELLGAIKDTATTVRQRWLIRCSERVAKSLAAVRSSGAYPLSDRVRAGNSLAVIGDPLLAGLPVDYPTVPVSGGVAKIGSSLSIDTIGDKPKYEKIHWYPPYETRLESYDVGIHPVTNYEYAKFIEAGGYDNTRYWHSPEAKMWLAQDEKTLDQLMPIVQDSLGLHYRKDIQAGFMSVVDYETMRDQFIRKLILRREPLHWHDPRFNRPNQPVVGVNLWEAKAYCAWLTDLMRVAGRIGADKICRLPTEEEWEFAAGPENHVHPWGSDWDPSKCHMRNTPWIASAVSIGTFDWVDSHLGCRDMIGNVFDMTLSAADEYLNRPLDHAATEMREIVTRGGSWLATAEAARSIRFRSWDPPCNSYADQGFRVVISSLDLP